MVYAKAKHFSFQKPIDEFTNLIRRSMIAEAKRHAQEVLELLDAPIQALELDDDCNLTFVIYSCAEFKAVLEVIFNEEHVALTLYSKLPVKILATLIWDGDKWRLDSCDDDGFAQLGHPEWAEELRRRFECNAES